MASAATAAAFSHTSASSSYCGAHSSPVGLFSILTNNLRLASILVLGGFLLGAPTVVELALNGFVLGSTVSQLQAVPMVFVAGVLPHGVLELAGEIVAGSIGLRFARTELNLIRNRDAELSMKPIAVNAGVAILLVSVAASIETFVTPALLSGLCR